MQLSTIICVLFAGTALSAATTTPARPAATAAAKAAVPRVLAPATPPTPADVQSSISNWMTSVKTVNDYLNNPTNMTKLASAIVFAKDEPVQLGTLMKVSGLTTNGANAGKILMGNFPSIISNLNSVMGNVMTTNDATAAVNFNRCCTVLPAISSLWKGALIATKAANVTMPVPLEDQCASMSCASGISGGMPNAVNVTGPAASMAEGTNGGASEGVTIDPEDPER